MLSEQEHMRYSRQTMLPEIGIAGQELLAAARVLVIGAGGLGCPVLTYLTAAGVGTIGIADGDIVSITNLQRQILYGTADIGNGKAVTAAKRLKEQNPDINIIVHECFADSSNILDLIAGYDIVVDGSDNFDTRYLVNDACVMTGKPMVSGAIYRFEGQVSVFNYKGGPTYRCIFPEPPGAGESPNCAEIGVVATLPGIVGTIQANEVIKMITGAGEVLAGRLLVIDALTLTTHTFRFPLVTDNLLIKELPELHMNTCKTAVQHLLSMAEIQRMLASDANTQLVDVREPEEHALRNIGGINLPISAPESKYHILNPTIPVVLYCASGKRSAFAYNALKAAGFTEVYELKGGINAVTE